MQIKSQGWLIYLYGELAKKQAIFKELYAAVGLLILASVLLFLVTSAIQGRGLQHAKENEAALQTESKVSPSLAAVTDNIPGSGVQEETTVRNETPQIPLKGAVVLAFGWQQHPVYKDWRYHTGMDIGARGKQDVQAIFSGLVTDIYTDKHSGLTVVVEGKDYKIFYGSLSTAAVTKDSHVNAGQYVGKTGVCREEPQEHLHLAVKKADSYINPASLF
ncbi:MAG: M23 family metallopeptidase [Pelosinus sp.]|nr:M23 family metallopeptidase [Pelosinus sp.]